MNWHKIYDYYFDFQGIPFSLVVLLSTKWQHFKSFVYLFASVFTVNVTANRCIHLVQLSQLTEVLSEYAYATHRTDEILIYWKVNNRRMPSSHTHKWLSQRQCRRFGSFDSASHTHTSFGIMCKFVMLFLSHPPIDDRSVYNLFNKVLSKIDSLYRFVTANHSQLLSLPIPISSCSGSLSASKRVCTSKLWWTKKKNHLKLGTFTPKARYFHVFDIRTVAVSLFSSFFFFSQMCVYLTLLPILTLCTCVFSLSLQKLWHVCDGAQSYVRPDVLVNVRIFWQDDESTPHKCAHVSKLTTERYVCKLLMLLLVGVFFFFLFIFLFLSPLFWVLFAIFWLYAKNEFCTEMFTVFSLSLSFPFNDCFCTMMTMIIVHINNFQT